MVRRVELAASGAVTRVRSAAPPALAEALAPALGLMAGLVAGLMAGLLLVPGTESGSVAVVLLAVAAAAVAVHAGSRASVAVRELRPVTVGDRTRPLQRVGLVTDPVHHPLRPRAPGIG